MHRRAKADDTLATTQVSFFVIQAIRAWVARDPAARTSWLGALRDQQIGRAIALIHCHPTRHSLASLANAIGILLDDASDA